MAPFLKETGHLLAGGLHQPPSEGAAIYPYYSGHRPAFPVHRRSTTNQHLEVYKTPDIPHDIVSNQGTKSPREVYQ